MIKKILRVVLKDGSVREYLDGEFLDYDWRPEIFIVKNGDRWVAMFNWDCVREALLIDVEEVENG